MTTLVLATSHSDSPSSPYIDYSNDVAYVGDDGGRLHKITPAFRGTPAEVTTGGWPVQLTSAGQILSAVYDSVTGRVFVTDNGGNFYVVNAGTGALVATTSLSIFTPSEPILDTTDQTVFVFYPDSTLHLSVSQFDTSGTLLRKVTAGLLSGSVNVYSGAFDNNYFNNPSSGLLYFAGAVNNVASVYSVGFTGTTMNASISGPLALSTSATTSEPTPLTEIFNPTFSSAKDRLFVGIDANCATSSANGCVQNLDISGGLPPGILNSYTVATAGATFSVSGIIVDNVSSSAQASSIYFESVPVSSVESAIKVTQQNLQ
jgi:hypothetical protein